MYDINSANYQSYLNQIAQMNNYRLQELLNMNPNTLKPVDNLLNIYLNKEGIDRRYSRLILQELYDATELSNDQLNQAADEIISSNVLSQNNANNTKTNYANGKIANNSNLNPNV